tara:strand:+ start:4443 stop:5858 length:1416 start_codon:yes stop_codon:yes gene_type:complete
MTLYSYRIGDTKQGRLVFTTDKNLKKDFPKTFGISKSAMILDKFDSVGLYKVLGMERERDFQADLSVDDFPSTPMFTNKRVLVIGNGSSLLDNECGDIIDSYDIVIRINHCLTKGIEKYVGTKTDIWATTHLHYHKNPNKTTFYPSEKHNVKVVWKRTSNVKKIDMSKFNKNVNLFTMFKRKDNYDVMKDYNWKNLKIKHEPCTGLLTICTALKFFKNVDVIGFDFYTDSDKPTDYYREFELDKDGNHLEDKLYQKQIEIGFCSKDIGKSKLEFLQKLEDDGYLKILYKEKNHPIVKSIQGKLKDNMDGTPFVKELHEKIKKSDFKDGFVRLFWQNGNKRYEWYYKNGFQEGIAMGFWPNGSKKSQRTYHLGKLHGKNKTWYSDGKLAGKRYYKKNIKHGLLTNYYPNGRVWEEILYNKGVIIDSQYWTEDGKECDRISSEIYKKEHNLSGINHDEVHKDFLKNKKTNGEN